MSTQAPEYKAHEQAVIDLQTALLDRGAGEIEGEVAEVDRDVEEVRARSAAFLRDRGSVFRFLKKAHYNSEKAYEKIKRHVGVRLQSNLDHLEVPPLLCVDEELEADSSHPPHPPVAYFLKHNHHSRLVLVIALSQIAPRHTPINGANDAKDANDDDDDAFDEIKESILYIWEVGRRLMQQASEERGWEHCLDFLTIVDAHNASMKNMHYDIVKFFSDIISIHFPNTSKQILIVNSRMWTNALWRMAMPLLPKKIVDRISFAGAAKLAEVLDLDTLPKHLGGQGEYKRVSDYAITRVPDTHAAAITRNSSRNTVWYTPRQTPASSYTNVPKLASKIPSFQLAIRRGGGEGSGGRRQSDTIDTQDIANYREQISAWHKDKIGEGIAGVAGLSTYDAAATATTASSGVGTPIATLDRYSCLNPRYGYKTIYKMSRRNGELIMQSQPRMLDLVVTLLHLACKRHSKRLKVVLMVQNRRAILENLFKEGVIVAQKDYEIKHDELNVPNLEVIKLMQSLTSKGFVKTQFSWQWFYYTLTPEGLDYLREFLHLPSEIVPNTHRKAQRPARPAQARQQGEAYRAGRDDRDSYRRADAKEGADAGYRPRFGGVGRGAPRA